MICPTSKLAIVHYFCSKRPAVYKNLGLPKKQFPVDWLLSIHLEDYVSQARANSRMPNENATTCFVISRRLAARGKKRDSHWVEILKQNKNGPTGLRLIAVSVYRCALFLSHAPQAGEISLLCCLLCFSQRHWIRSQYKYTARVPRWVNLKFNLWISILVLTLREIALFF